MWGPPRFFPVVLGAFLLPLSSSGASGQDPSETPGHPFLLSQPARLRASFLGQGLPFLDVRNPGTHLVTPAGELLESLLPLEAGPAPTQSFQPQIPGPGRAFLYSALLPGLGQRTMGQDRWIAYLAGEAWAWIQFFQRRREGHSLQRRYRELAWLVARRVSSGPRVDGNFEYYEAMTQFPSSGAFDADPDITGVQPEDDPDTFNGSIWILARQIFFLDDPEQPAGEDSDQYQDALRYYRSRAYTPDFAWNWGTNTLQQGEFTGLIRSSDENLRRSTTMIGVILANHLLSAVDALVSGRLGQVGSGSPTVQLHLIPGPFHQHTLFLTLRIPSP